MRIRQYRPSDCRELAELFCDTVRTVIGFGAIDGSGYLDRLHIHRHHRGKGVALTDFVMEKQR